MKEILGVLLATIFAILGLMHTYWALGGMQVSETFIPSVNGKQVFTPSPFLTILVALALFMAMLVILGQVGFLGSFISKKLFYFGTATISLVFFLRSIGEFRLVGFFKKITDTKFAYWDTWVFSPLCLLISIMSFLLLLELTKKSAI
ncbi:MAG: DUF3995 domain-containing protein [Acidobacteria bacterium]|nr:DUF3995 domain-containing protein [Acidobacteriota bacterium]